MTGIIIKAIVGLFIWLVLPELINKKMKSKKNTKSFISISCSLIGIVILVFTGIDFFKYLLSL